MIAQELAIGDGCGLKLDLGNVLDIANFNSGGVHPSNQRSVAQRWASEYAVATGGSVSPDNIGDFIDYVAQGDTLQPGLDAGYHWIKTLGAFSVSTTDAMTPPTDNPETFGRISALHVMSDLWVAGADPVEMQQYLVLPSQLSLEILARALSSFKDTCDQFGVTITGGHTRQEGNDYLVGGTATGYTHKRFDINRPRVGDLIVSTKALGTSVAIAAHKMVQHGYAGDLPESANETIRAAETSMTVDNQIAVAMRRGSLVTSCTDITGFGLMGHLSNLINPVGKAATIELDQLPIIDGVIELLEAGVHTHAGDRAQIEYADRQGDLGTLQDPRFHAAFLPETSGGILATVRPGLYDSLTDVVEEAGQTLTVIGQITVRNSAGPDDYRFAGITLS